MMVDSKYLAEFVGNKIRRYRKLNSWTQKELGEMIGVKANTISAYERGVISPEQDMLFALSNVFNVSINDLFPEKENITDELERALRMTNNLKLKDVELLNTLIEKTLSLEEDDRERFLDSIKFTVEYYDNMNEKIR